MPNLEFAPYAVIGPVEETLEANIGAPQYVNHITEAPGTKLDPDGDDVTFESSSLPTVFAVLDAVNGVITVAAAPEGDLAVTVWTEDENGLASEEFVITLHFTAPS